MSIYRDINAKEIHIYSDAGRICRPLLIVNNENLVLQQKHIDMLKDKEQNFMWSDLIRGGVIEYIDVREEETTMVRCGHTYLSHLSVTHVRHTCLLRIGCFCETAF